MKNFFRGFNKLGGKLIAILFIGFVIIASILFIFGTYFFGIAGFFNIFNVEYDSLEALFMFLVFFFILSFFTNLIAKGFLILLGPYLKTKKNVIRAKFVFHILSLWLAIFIINEMMVTIHIPAGIALLGATLLALADMAFSKRRKIMIIRRKK